MKKKLITCLPNPKTEGRSPVEAWHHGGDIEVLKFARSLQKAAKTPIGKLDLDWSAKTGWDICPVVFLYRQALEIHLKMLVGEGSNFLSSPTDPIALYKTHSLRWLAQIVCQIIRPVGWENEFTCEGVSSMADFSALVNEVESFDPVARAIRSSRSPNSVSENYRTFDLFKFATRLDAVLDRLDSSADALAATWDMQTNAMPDGKFDGRGFRPTIQ
jgi:hypothetical protein